MLSRRSRSAMSTNAPSTSTVDVLTSPLLCTSSHLPTHVQAPVSCGLTCATVELDVVWHRRFHDWSGCTSMAGVPQPVDSAARRTLFFTYGVQLSVPSCCARYRTRIRVVPSFATLVNGKTGCAFLATSTICSTVMFSLPVLAGTALSHQAVFH